MAPTWLLLANISQLKIFTHTEAGAAGLLVTQREGDGKGHLQTAGPGIWRWGNLSRHRWESRDRREERSSGGRGRSKGLRTDNTGGRRQFGRWKQEYEWNTDSLMK